MESLKNQVQGRIVFLTIGEPGYSRSWTYFNGLRQMGVPVEFLQIPTKNPVKEIFSKRKEFNRKKDIFIVMNPSHYLTLPVRVFLGRNVILDAGWSLYEGTLARSDRLERFFLVALKSFMIDFISAHASKKIILETKLQLNYYSKLFAVPKSKCGVVYSGVDEEAFETSTKISAIPESIFSNFTVLFRGKYNTEGGLQVLAKATKLLENEPINFIVMCPGLPLEIKFSSRTIIDRSIITKENLVYIQRKVNLSLGQLSDHQRLKHTIPHKAFEFAFLGIPYLTARNAGILEVFKEDVDVLCFQPGSAKDLANKILEVKKDPKKLNSISKNVRAMYEMNLSQTKLASTFLEKIDSL